MTMTTVQVPKHTRDHLAALAEERGMTLGQIVEAIAKEHPTRAQLDERAASARKHAREVVGVDMSDEDFRVDVLGNLRKIAAEKVLALRSGTADPA